MQKLLDLLDEIDLFTVGRPKSEQLHMTCGELFKITKKMRNVIAYNEDIELPTWHTADDKPEINHLVAVKTKDGYEEYNYIWNGEEWLIVEYGQGERVELETDFPVYVWRYQE